jgi:hypothetical protein
VGVEYLELLLVEPLEEAELEERHPLAIEDLAARVDRRRPVDGDVCVPLIALGLGVEIADFLLLDRV